jgi:aminoglycoside 6'-N-acetyltransferase
MLNWRRFVFEASRLLLISKNMLVQKEDILIRKMVDDIHDYKLMAKWLTDERVLEYYEGRDNPFPLDRIIDTYQPMVKGDELVIPCIFYYKNIPIGYLQYYLLNDLPECDRKKYCLEETDKIYGIDLFIGETNYWNKGIGSLVLSTLVKFLFEELQAVKVVTDPQEWNTRAIHFYEKCGFAKVKLLKEHELQEGKIWDCWLMAIEHNK